MHAFRTRPVIRYVLLSLLFLILGFAFLAPEKAVRSSLLETFGRLPLAFVENRGQLDECVAFSARQGGLEAFFTKDGIALQLASKKPVPKEDEKIQGANVFLTFEGASEDVRIEGYDPLPGRYNYFRGNDPSKWRTEVPTYASIRYCGLYQGVDMVVRDHNGRLEYDLILEPGADVDTIAVRCEGDELLRVDEEGRLIMETAAGPLEQPKPFTYTINQCGAREPVTCSYRLLDDDRFGFHVPGRDREMALVIDPELVFGTFLGGGSSDTGYAIAVDNSGAAVITGVTYSSDFPTTSGAFDTSQNGDFDVFFAKLSADGSRLVFGTFLGGKNTDSSPAIALDASGAAVITGVTDSYDFPTTPGAYDTSFNGGIFDAFVVKLSADGSSLIFGTFLGGKDSDWSSAMALDASGAAVVTGHTASSDFPTIPGSYDTSFNGGYHDAFAAKLSADGSKLLYGTFLGGGETESGYAMALDASGAAVVTGYTASSDFPFTAGAYDTSFNGVIQDAFVTKLSADGSKLLYGTFLGGGNSESGSAIALDASGAAVVVGETYSTDFPTTPGAYDTSFNGNDDVFVAKLSADGSNLLYGTFLGGIKNEDGTAVALNASDAAVVMGSTDSPDFPTTKGAYDTSLNGSWDAFVAKLSADGSSLLYGTYLGGADGDWCNAVALDASGAAVAVGSTESPDFPTTPDAYHTRYNGGSCDAFAVKLGMELAADTYTLSESAGGAVPFTLSAGAPNAQRNYLLLGSVSGIEPGTTLPGGGTVLHLNWDAFTNAGISLVNTFFFQDFMGSLDSQGLGTCTFNLPAGTGLPVGLTFYFAYALQGPPWDFASNTLEVTLVP